MTGPAIFTPEYYERIRALEAGGWWNAAMRDILERAIADAHIPPVGVLLDVGCGSGATLEWFSSRHPDWRCLGVDVAWEGLRAVPPLRSGGAVRASALALPVQSGSVDLIVSQDVLQHLPLNGGDLTALAEMRRVLKPGGALLLRTNAQPVPRTADDPDFQFHRYDTGELRRKLISAGFGVERLGRVNAVLGLAEIPRERKAFRETGRAYHGILAVPSSGRPRLDAVKRWWLSMEGRMVLRGWSLPLGRTHVARCLATRLAGRQASASGGRHSLSERR